MMASRFPRSLTAARRVMMALPPPRGIITSQKAITWIIGTQDINIGAVCGKIADSVAGKDVHTF
ncbi:hypothetical protein AAG906_000565 [Vitis piasezkii]